MSRLGQTIRKAPGMDSAVKHGRKIWHAPVPDRVGPHAAYTAATFGGLGIVTGTTNSVINNQYVQGQKKKQSQSFERGKYYGRSTA